MTLIEQILWSSLGLVGLLCSALWSGAETGCYTLNRVRLGVRAASGAKSAVRVRKLLDHPESLLATLLIGNNLSNYLGTMGLTSLLIGLGVAEAKIVLLNTVVLAPLILVFCEALPKEVFRRASDTLTYRIAGVLTLMRLVFTACGALPLVVWLSRAVGRLAGLGSVPGLVDSRTRIASLLKEGSASGAISETQSSLIDRATQFTGATVGEELVPWEGVRTIAAGLDRSRALLAMQRAGFAAYPVVDGRGRVVGMVGHIEVLLEREKPWASLVAPPVRVAPETRAVEALRLLRKAGQTLAIVEQNGRPVGLVTVKDLVEPLVGDLVTSAGL